MKYIPLKTPSDHERCRCLLPENMGSMTPINERNVGSHGRFSVITMARKIMLVPSHIK